MPLDSIGGGEEVMGKVITGAIVVLGLWVGVEVMTHGPARAFDGAFAGFMSDAEDDAAVVDDRSTARRSGDAVERARDAATARRDRMLGE